ncbi:MAG: tartrate dehydrogenase [Vicinamibacteria bacterium]|nr:tartrate dehydrogenase [Vicinamibacteria bacterium]
MSAARRIAVLPGDGIGPEVITSGLAVLRRAAEACGLELACEEFDWGCDHHVRTGRMMPADALDRLSGFDAIYLGAVGRPDVPDHVSIWDMILPIRQRFDQYVNLRPMALLPGVVSPLAGRGAAEIDMVCVRENSEGEYSGRGSRDADGAREEAVFTRRGILRVVRHAFALADRRPRRLLASATKSNALRHSMVLWDEVVAEVAREFPRVSWRSYHVDALAARMVTHPQTLDVIVGSNLFGDILTDLGAAISGSLGLGPGANLNPERVHPSMFEPIHGSAPDIAGKGIANPIGAIQAGAMLLDHLGAGEAATLVTAAVHATLAAGAPRTPDLGGAATTADVTQAILSRLP